MRKISVILDDITEEALDLLVKNNDATISDIVNVAILTVSRENIPLITEQSAWTKFKRYMEKNHPDTNLAAWCVERKIEETRLRYLINRTATGATVYGFGNLRHKERDKEDDREFKTHTSWIAHCLKEDFNIDITGDSDDRKIL